MRPIILTATLTFKEEFTNEAFEVLKTLHKETKANDEGCLQYDMHIDAEDKNTFVFVETWQSEEALDKHSKAKHFEVFKDFIDGKLISFKIQRLTKVA